MKIARRHGRLRDVDDGGHGRNPHAPVEAAHPPSRRHLRHSQSGKSDRPALLSRASEVSRAISRGLVM